jgi:hypothetical protein
MDRATSPANPQTLDRAPKQSGTFHTDRFGSHTLIPSSFSTRGIATLHGPHDTCLR